MKLDKQIIRKLAVLLLLVISSSVLAKTHTVEQRNKSFMRNDQKIAAININVGDKVEFKNNDTVFHNIFSMSKINKFNLGAFGTGKSESVTFKKAGKASIECAIHPRMVLEVTVSK